MAGGPAPRPPATAPPGCSRRGGTAADQQAPHRSAQAAPARGHRARRAPSQFLTSLVLPPAPAPAGSSSGHVVYTGGRTRSSRELAAAGPATEALATASKGSRRDSIRRGQTIISRLEGHPELADVLGGHLTLRHGDTHRVGDLYWHRPPGTRQVITPRSRR